MVCDAKPTHEHEHVEVMDILKISMGLIVQDIRMLVLGWRIDFSTIYLTML